MVNRLAVLARRQSGVWTRDQARQAGLSDKQIRRAVAIGTWREVEAEVFAMAATPDGPALSQSALLLRLPAEAALAGDSSAAAWEVPGFVMPARPEAVVQHDTQVAELRVGTVRRVKQDVLDRAVRRNGVRVMSLEDTVRDLAVTMTADEVEAIVTDLLNRERRTSPERLLAVCRRGRPGSARLRAAVNISRDGAQSTWQRRLVAALRAAGLEPESELGIVDASGKTVYGDIVFVEARLVVEVDGWAAHGSPGRARADKRRKRKLVLGPGWHVVEVTPADIRDSLDEIVAEIAAFVRARTPVAG